MSSWLTYLLPELLIIAWIVTLVYRVGRRLRAIEARLSDIEQRPA